MALSIAFVFVLTALGVLSFPEGIGGPSGPNPPLGVHLSYLDNPTTAVLTWHTKSASSSRADWGKTPGPPYAFSAKGTNYTSPGGSFLHNVTLKSLAPGLRYYYRVGDETMASSYGEASFRAALLNGSTESFSFAAAGDWGNSTQTTATSGKIQAQNPDLVLPLGDLYYSSLETDVKGVFEKWQAFGQGSFVQTIIGNHEFHNGGSNTAIEVHCAFVNLPGNERTYSFKFGNTLFLAIDWGADSGNLTDGVDASGASCKGTAGTTAIRAWLDGRLAAANLDPDITWKVVLQHFQCYDMTNQSYNLMCPDAFTNTKIDQMEDIMNKRGVDLVLFGHDHTYGRTHPVSFHKAIQTGSSYDTPGAPIYFDLGTGGSSGTFPNCRKDPWVAVCRAPIETSGFGRFVVSPTTVRYDFLENSAGIVDSFTLTKRPATDYVVSVDPASAILTPGAMTTANVSILGASSNPVALSVTGCPSGTTCTFNPTSGNPSFASTFRVQTSPSSPNGNFDLVIAGKNATQSRTVTFHLTIGSHVIVSFRRGDGGAFSQVNDTHIYDTTPNVNFGTAAKLLVDGDKCINQAGVCKTLIKFPSIIGPSTGQIPAGSTIVNATLELTIVNTGDPMDVYQVTEAWTELGATWNSFTTPGIPGNRGKEFTVSPSVLGKFSISITKIAQRWANGDVNQGLLLASALADGSDYSSSESTGGPRPLLRVEFFPPPPSFDFSLSVSPSSGYVVPGGSVSATVTATLVSAATRNVQYSCTNLPSGATCTFTPPSCNPTCTANVVFATSPSTPGGTYPTSVQATNGTITRTSGFTLTVGGLVLYYDMQNLTADGRMKDLSGAGNHGNITGTTDVAGKVGRARSFNSVSDTIVAVDSPSLHVNGAAITIAAWVNAPLQGEGTVVVKEDSFILGINGGRLMAAVETTASGGWTWGGSQAVPLNEWAHIAFVYNGTSWKFYVNGILREAIPPAGGQTGNIVPTGLPLEVGKRSRYSLPFKGTIDEVYLFSRALTDKEVSDLAGVVATLRHMNLAPTVSLGDGVTDLPGAGCAIGLPLSPPLIRAKDGA